MEVPRQEESWEWTKSQTSVSDTPITTTLFCCLPDVTHVPHTVFYIVKTPFVSIPSAVAFVYI